MALTGEVTEVGVNIALGFTLSIVVPAGLVKVLWDRSQKRRQRARIQELEAENLRLAREMGKVEGQMAELKRNLSGQA